jgi:hypothetical protein
MTDSSLFQFETESTTGKREAGGKEIISNGKQE